MAHVFLADKVDLSRPDSRRPRTVDSIVRELCDSRGHSRVIIRLVKLWAASHDLVGRHYQQMTIAASTLLVLIWLQKEGYAPAYAQLVAGDQPPLNPFDFLKLRLSLPPLGASVSGTD